MSRNRRKREPLDALRGVAALGVALGSWIGVTVWSDTQIPVNLVVLADFVLVIGGFITARAHAEPLLAGRSLGRFALSRVVRFAPLHVACLALVLAAEFGGRSIVGQPLPTDAGGFLSSLFLMQLFFPSGIAWNLPAWIIAAEVHMSLLFAALCVIGVLKTRRRRQICIGLICAVVGSRIFLADSLPPPVDLLLRVTVAFMSGVLIYFAIWAPGISAGLRRLKKHWGGLVEAWFLACSVMFVLVVPTALHPIAPGILSGCLIVFLRRRAAFARMMEAPLLQKFGDLSYPILLIHMSLVMPFIVLTDQFGADMIAVPATLLTPVYLFSILYLSGFAVNYIEFPTRRAMWAWLDRAFPGAEVNPLKENAGSKA